MSVDEAAIVTAACALSGAATRLLAVCPSAAAEQGGFACSGGYFAERPWLSLPTAEPEGRRSIGRALEALARGRRGWTRGRDESTDGVPESSTAVDVSARWRSSVRRRLRAACDSQAAGGLIRPGLRRAGRCMARGGASNAATSAPRSSTHRWIAAPRASLTDASTVDSVFERAATGDRSRRKARVTDLHITARTAWDAALGAGIYEADSLSTEGFIHCSTAEQYSLGGERALPRDARI